MQSLVYIACGLVYIAFFIVCVGACCLVYIACGLVYIACGIVCVGAWAASYVSIRQHTSAYVGAWAAACRAYGRVWSPTASLTVPTAYVSIRHSP